MKITEIHVDDFGVWHDLRLPDLTDRATVIYGPNEAGKTTLLNFVRTVLYGYSATRCGRYLPPASGAEAGGSLQASAVSGRFQIRRWAPPDYQGGPGTVRIHSADDDVQHGSELLTTLLSGVDESTFNNVFAVGLTQLQELATLSDTDAAQQLYGLATGGDRVSLHEVTRELTARREALLTGDARAPGRLNQLLEQREKLQREIQALRRDADHWGNLRVEYAQLCRDMERRREAHKQLQQQGDWREVSTTLRQHWTRCIEIYEALSRLGPLADIPEHIGVRVKELTGQILERRQQWEKLRRERRRFKARARKLQGRDTLYRHAAEVEALDRQRTRILALEADVTRGRTQVEELEFELQAELEELGLQVGASAKQLPQVSDQVIEALREPARETREIRQHVDAAKKAAADCREESQRIKQQLDAAVVRFGGEDVAAATDRGRQLVAQLERRLELDEQRDDIVRRLEGLQKEKTYWLQRSVLPWRGVLASCALFSAGAMLLMTGLLSSWFGLEESSRLGLMLVGGALAFVSLVIKGAFERTAQQRAESSEHQLQLLWKRQKQARAESEELDRELPTGGGNLDQRLIDARRELADFEQLFPLRNRCQDLMREAEAADQQTTLAVRRLKEARRVWKASLRAVGLPDTLTPSHIGQMAGRVGDVTRLRGRLAEARQELDERRGELTIIRERIEQLQSLAEINDPSDGLGPQLDGLLAELEKHARSGRERDELKQRWDELGQRQQRLARAAKQAMETRRQLLTGHGIASMHDFRQTLERGDEARRLRSEREDLLTQIAAGLGGDVTADKLRKCLAKRVKFVPQRLDELDDEQRALATDLADMQQRRDQLKQQLDAHLQDRRYERKDLRLHALDEKIRLGTQQWLCAAMSSTVLEKVRENYEKKRQPVTLAEASRYLERLTDGGYTRIWTPLGEHQLRVDPRGGGDLPVEKLSRGTREQVFLALRLALVASYQRRGAGMPMVLDDVFVNFDDQRARMAAHVLTEVAEAGQQMLIFTCHQRMRDIFAELGADVRRLPERQGQSSVRSAQAIVASPPARSAEKTASVEKTAAATLPTPAVVAEAPGADLPVYDADAWEESPTWLDLPAIPAAKTRPATPKPGDTRDDQWKQEPILSWKRSHQSADTTDNARFQPAWRDEHLAPLPDLAAVEGDEDEDDWLDDYYLGAPSRQSV